MNKRSLIQMLALVSVLSAGVVLPAAAHDDHRGKRAESDRHVMQPVHYRHEQRHGDRHASDRREWRRGGGHGHGHHRLHRHQRAYWIQPRGYFGTYVPSHAPMRHGYRGDRGDSHIDLNIFYRGGF